MSIEDEIRSKTLERINSIYYQFIIREEISKSDNTVPVKGEDIKKSLSDNLKLKNNSLEKYSEILKNAVNNIGVIPMSSPDSYIPETWKGEIDVPHMLYSYSQTYNQGVDSKMFQYNRGVKDFIQKSIISKKLSVIIDSITEEQQYNIPVGVVNKINDL